MIYIYTYVYYVCTNMRTTHGENKRAKETERERKQTKCIWWPHNITCGTIGRTVRASDETFPTTFFPHLSSFSAPKHIKLCSCARERQQKVTGVASRRFMCAAACTQALANFLGPLSSPNRAFCFACLPRHSTIVSERCMHAQWPSDPDKCAQSAGKRV